MEIGDTNYDKKRDGQLMTITLLNCIYHLNLIQESSLTLGCMLSY